MSFLKLLHGMKKRKDLFDIACDYDGYDIVYEEETTDVNLYKFFNEIITNLRYDITVLPEYLQPRGNRRRRDPLHLLPEKRNTSSRRADAAA